MGSFEQAQYAHPGGILGEGGHRSFVDFEISITVPRQDLRHIQKGDGETPNLTYIE